MPVYETVFIARQELGNAQVEELTQGFAKFLTDNGGAVLKTESWGLRTLAYKINKNRKGHYVLIESDSPPAALLEAERNMRLSEDILRYMSVRLDEPTKAQSKILDKSRDDDDRDGGRENFRSRPPREDGERGPREGREGGGYRGNRDNQDKEVA